MFQAFTEPSKDTTIPIWEHYFRVRVPYEQTRPVEELRLTGTPISGIKGYDNEIADQWMTTMMPIAYMVELYQKGIPVKVCDITDTKTIYEFISDHIYAWKSRLERGINLGDAPIDDLIAMDEFANLVYDHARHEFTRDMADSLIARYFNRIHGFNIHTFFKPIVAQTLSNSALLPGVTRINGDLDPTEDRESLSDFFKDRIISLANNRRYGP